VHIGHQQAGRDVRNYEITVEQMNVELERRTGEIEALVQKAVASGTLSTTRATQLEDAAHAVVAAATDLSSPTPRLMRAMQVLKNLSAAAVSTAGIAEAVDKMIHTVTGA
jgi:hypothetical protein